MKNSERKELDVDYIGEEKLPEEIDFKKISEFICNNKRKNTRRKTRKEQSV